MKTLTTNGGPQYQVHAALNFISLNGLPCLTHAFLNRQLANPIDNHAIYARKCHPSAPNTRINASKITHLIRHPHNILQPPPQFPAPDETAPKAQQADAAGSHERRQRDALGGGPREYARALAGEGEPVEDTRAGEEGVVPRGEDGGQDDGVHE